MTKIYNNILETVGRTPVVKLNKLAPEGVDVFVKVESFNPLGSVKDRLALGIIEAAEADGSLKPGQTVVEATSGNTGIGLAMVCAQKGYPLVVVMAESFSVERRKLMRFLGAKVILTPAAEKGTGMYAKAVELADEHGWFLARQFENEAGVDIHSDTTAPEILEAFEGRRLDYWVTGAGTGSTLKGVARVLKDKRPETKIIVCEPDNVPILVKGIPAEPAPFVGGAPQSHPDFRPHLMQGWSPDFIPKLTRDAMVSGLVDEVVPVSGDNALRLARGLALKEGIFCGTSGGATLAGALAVAARAPKGSSILCMLPDTGERYLSTPLFEHITSEMTDEELEISQSTPRFRFDKPGAPAKPAAVNGAAVAAKPSAHGLVESMIGANDRPVVMFALEWCEFCWSVRKFFAAADIPYRAVCLDSAEFQKDNLGGDIRVALRERIGAPTIPQIFVGGQHIGGCSETFDSFKDGRLQALLEQNSIAFNTQKEIDPYSFLPKWVHPR